MALNTDIWLWTARHRSSLEHRNQAQGLFFQQRLSYKSKSYPTQTLQMAATGLYYTLHNIGVCIM